MCRKKLLSLYYCYAGEFCNKTHCHDSLCQRTIGTKGKLNFPFAGKKGNLSGNSWLTREIVFRIMAADNLSYIARKHSGCGPMNSFSADAVAKNNHKSAIVTTANGCPKSDHGIKCVYRSVYWLRNSLRLSNQSCLQPRSLTS